MIMSYHLWRKLNPFNRRACYLLIAGAFLFFLVFIGYRYVFSDGGTETQARTVGVSDRLPDHRVDFSPVVFDAAAYYRPILEYNLFRPLGWTPPRPVEPYRLIGTILPRDANTPAKAILESNSGNQTFIVSVGDRFDDATEVVEIRPKQVVLSTNGKKRTLRLWRVF